MRCLSNSSGEAVSGTASPVPTVLRGCQRGPHHAPLGSAHDWVHSFDCDRGVKMRYFARLLPPWPPQAATAGCLHSPVRPPQRYRTKRRECLARLTRAAANCHSGRSAQDRRALRKLQVHSSRHSYQVSVELTVMAAMMPVTIAAVARCAPRWLPWDDGRVGWWCPLRHRGLYDSGTVPEKRH